MSNLTWGDTVKVKRDAPIELRPEESASVCGIREVRTHEEAQRFKTLMGKKIYLIEFGDGESLEISEEWINPEQ